MTIDTLEAALYYQSIGLSALPLCPPNHAGCTAHHIQNCGSPGKSPWIKWKNGEKNYIENLPTPEEIRGWWQKNPASNVGAAMGRVSRLVRIDPDNEIGDKLLLEKSGGELPPATVRSRWVH